VVRTFKTKVVVLSCCAGAVAASFLAALDVGKNVTSQYQEIRGSNESGPYCGLLAVAAVAKMHGKTASLSEIYVHTGLTEQGVNLLRCKKALEAIGIKVEAREIASIMDVPEGHPALCTVRSTSGLHAVAILRRGREVLLVDGQRREIISCSSFDEFNEHVVLISSHLHE
jgi:ABC-type bacteriocin/lantibiotic exporter with double-glycine peptidase domain